MHGVRTGFDIWFDVSAERRPILGALQANVGVRLRAGV